MIETDVTALSPDDRVQRVRSALAEVGFGDLHVYWCEVNEFGDPPAVRVVWSGDSTDISSAVWRAFVVSGEVRVCWPCWSDGGTWETCDHDPLTSPWPEVIR